MIFTVEAWFHNSKGKNVLALLHHSLAVAGFTEEATLTRTITSWNHVKLAQHKVFIALGFRTEGHFVVTLMARVGWGEGYSAFERVFTDLLCARRDIELAELLFSIRNPQPYPFLTHSFCRFSSSPTIRNCEKKNRVIQGIENDYWEQLGPELHFIADEVFGRASAEVTALTHHLNVAAIELEGGVLLDCGWTSEFALPSQMLSTW